MNTIDITITNPHLEKAIRTAHELNISRRDAGRRYPHERALLRGTHKICGNTWWPTIVSDGSISLRLDWEADWVDHLSGRNYPIYAVVQNGAKIGTYCPEPYTEHFSPY